MTQKPKKSWTEHAGEVAEQMYDPADYESSSEVARGIAETHEQAGDVYTSGTSDGESIDESDIEND